MEEDKKDLIPKPTGPQPIQELYHDPAGTVRFRENRIVEDLLNFATPRGMGMNEIFLRDYQSADRVQFAQLIGYSLDGFAELCSYVSDEDYGAAARKFTARNEGSDTEQRNAYLRNRLKEIQDGMRDALGKLYGCHPDDIGKTDV